MLNRISGRRWSAQVDAFVKEADRMIREYGWQDKEVYPYSYPVPVTEIVDSLRDFDSCTRSSQGYLVDLANGLAGIMNSWETYEKMPKRSVRDVETGHVFSVSEEMAEMLLMNEGFEAA